MELTAHLIAQLLPEARLPGAALPRAVGVEFSTERLRPGQVFFALQGERGHGIRFAPQAVEMGAAFVVSDRDYPGAVIVPDARKALYRLAAYAREQLRGPVVAVSGSVGKTTTKQYLACALNAFYSAGNLNTLPALAARMVGAAVEDPERPLVLELGIDHPGEMEQLVELVRPDIGVLTAIAPSHLERLGSLEGVAREKSLLLKRSPVRFASLQAAALLPEPVPGLQTYGLRSECRNGLQDEPGVGVQGCVASKGEWHQEVKAGGATFTVNAPGCAVATNAVAAFAVGRSLGIPATVLSSRLSQCNLEDSRLQLKKAGDLRIIDDSYNSNPASAASALDVLREQPQPWVAILGDMLELGEESRRYHLEIGEASIGLDLVIAVGPEAAYIQQANPRSLTVHDAEEATRLLHRIPAGATVLVKGSRGVRLEKVVQALLQASRDGERAASGGTR